MEYVVGVDTHCVAKALCPLEHHPFYDVRWKLLEDVIDQFQLLVRVGDHVVEDIPAGTVHYVGQLNLTQRKHSPAAIPNIDIGAVGNEPVIDSRGPLVSTNSQQGREVVCRCLRCDTCRSLFGQHLH